MVGLDGHGPIILHSGLRKSPRKPRVGCSYFKSSISENFSFARVTGYPEITTWLLKLAENTPASYRRALQQGGAEPGSMRTEK